MTPRALVLLVLLTLMACHGHQEPPSPPPGLDWRARLRTANAAFPAQPLPSCTARVDGPVLVFGRGLALCSVFGDEEVLRDYRPSEPTEWHAKRLAAGVKLVIFAASTQISPEVLGTEAGHIGTLKPGLIEGRAVVYTLEGQPECELRVEHRGPDQALASASRDLASDASHRLCAETESALRGAVARPANPR